MIKIIMEDGNIKKIISFEKIKNNINKNKTILNLSYIETQLLLLL